MQALLVVAVAVTVPVWDYACLAVLPPRICASCLCFLRVRVLYVTLPCITSEGFSRRNPSRV